MLAGIQSRLRPPEGRAGRSRCSKAPLASVYLAAHLAALSAATVAASGKQPAASGAAQLSCGRGEIL